MNVEITTKKGRALLNAVIESTSISPPFAESHDLFVVQFIKAAIAPHSLIIIHSSSKPWVVNFRVRLFSVTVRTTFSGVLASTSASISRVTFIVAAHDKDAALALLATLNTPAARSAALRIVTNNEQAAGLIAWVERADLTLNSFDSEGKFFLIANELAAERWQEAADHASQVTDADMRETPVLHHAVGMACLVQAVPFEIRSTVLSRIPFDVASFPLAADPTALAARRRAIKAFEAIAAFALKIGVAAASNPEADLALWLKLRDPQAHDEGMEDLRKSMRDPEQSLCRLPFALQFGLKLDLATIKKEIDRRVALSGRGNAG